STPRLPPDTPASSQLARPRKRALSPRHLFPLRAWNRPGAAALIHALASAVSTASPHYVTYTTALLRRGARRRHYPYSDEEPEMGGGWVLDVDIKSFFDTLDHEKLR